ncbi:MAG: amino acid permease [Candidatus Cloacimonadota bacterium]|nr:amino acid permease [Candidatus Cloacimonadota bacterium]
MGLKKQLGLLDVFCIAAGAMISSGLFVLPGIAFAKCGPAVIIAYLFAGIIFIPSLLSKAELGTAMPRAGGSYFFIERSMGPAAGTLGGFVTWFSLALKSAFALIGIGAFTILIFPQITELQIKIIAVAFCVIFIILNLKSVKHTGRLQIILVLSLLGILFIYSTFGIKNINLEKYIPFSPQGFSSIIPVVGLVFISFAGVTKIASVAEEIKNPKRNLPLGMFLSFFIVLVFYIIVIFITVGVLTSEQWGNLLKPTLTPISDGAGVFMGSFGMIILAIAALFAFFSTANAGILSASRFPLAMSRDHLLPEFFGKISKKYGTPYISIILTGIFMIVMISSFNLENLVKAASTMQIILFIYVNASVIVMRESKIQTYRPSFHSPLYPWIQIAAIIIYGFLIFEMGKIPLIITGCFIILSILWYLIYVRFRVKRKSALIHIVERLTDKKIKTTTLVKELKDILVERDNIIEDRFDKLISKCEILDIERSMTAEEFFKIIAEHLSKRQNINADMLYDLLIKREEQSTTALQPGMAIPHIIIEGNNKFDILLARCKEGVIFSLDLPPVYTVFVLIGTRDERNFHLRALMSIAQIVQQPDFERHWLKAKDIEDLRNIILLSERKRDES